VYDGPTTLTINAGQTLAGTNIAYQGKTANGMAKITIGGLEAPKQSADSVTWSGSPVPNTTVNLNTRVVTFDAKSITLAGTVHVVVANPLPRTAPGPDPKASALEFTVPVAYSLKPGDNVLGTVVIYAGATADGAKFDNLGGYPYRQQFDSIVWDGYVQNQVFLHLDVRILNFSESDVALAGTANVKLVP
jgi:hypothetical protein